jgi:hypothetical protein
MSRPPSPPNRIRLRVERESGSFDLLRISLGTPDEETAGLLAEFQRALPYAGDGGAVIIPQRFAGTVVPALRRLVDGAAIEYESPDVQEEVERRIREAEAHRCPRGQPHTVRVQDGQILVFCHFEDRDQAKRIPGYRWDPELRAWVYPDTRLHVAMVAFAYINAGEGPAGMAAWPAPAEQPPVGVRAPSPATWSELEAASRQLLEASRRTEERATELAEAYRKIGERLERLERRIADGLERLEHGLSALREVAAIPGARDVASGAPAAPASRRPEELLDLCRTDPRSALEEIARQLAIEPSATWRALEAYAAANAGDWERSLRWLEATSGVALPRSIANARRETVARAASALLANALAAEAGDIESAGAALATALEGPGLGPEHRAGLADAAASRHWHWIVAEAPDLEALKRLAEALSVAPGPDGSSLVGLLTIVRSGAPPQVRRAALLGAACWLAGAAALAEVRDWWPAAPPGQRAHLGEAAGALVQLVDSLPAADRPAAGVAALALVAALDQELADMNLRRRLLRAVPHDDERRALAEFLAVFRPAVLSQGAPAPDQYPGLASELIRRVKARTVGEESLDAYLQEMALVGSQAWGRALSEHGVLGARIEAFGLPEGDTLDGLLELAKAESDGAGLNRLAALVEDRNEIPSSREARERLYQAALAEAAGNRDKGREAFLRLLRHAQAAWEPEAVRAWLAEWCNKGHRSIRVLASIEYATAMLDTVDTPDQVATVLAPLQANLQGQPPPELAGEVLFLWRELRERFGDGLALPEIPLPAVEPPADAPPPRRLRLLVVGGHQRVRRHALPQLEARGHEVQWLGPDEAKDGNQLPQAAAGACDHVLVIVPYISHAATERARTAAGDRCVLVNANGVTGLLREVDRLAAQPGP